MFGVILPGDWQWSQEGGSEDVEGVLVSGRGVQVLLFLSGDADLSEL